jgi:lysyl-tRNA synthetase class 2
MGLKPSEYRSSVEQLVRRQLKDDPAHIGIPVVDLYNSVSKEYIVPFGAYDLEKLTDEEIQIRMIRPSRDQFRPLGGRPERFPLNERVVAYTQGDMILCWALNVRDNELTAVRESSKRILFLSESLNYETSEASDLSMSALEKSISDQDGVVISRFSVGGK